MVLGRKEAIWIARVDQFALARQIFVIARVQRVLAALFDAELECEERVFAPWDVGVDVDFVEALREMGKTFTANRTKIDLRTCCEVD